MHEVLEIDGQIYVEALVEGLLGEEVGDFSHFCLEKAIIEQTSSDGNRRRKDRQQRKQDRQVLPQEQ